MDIAEIGMGMGEVMAIPSGLAYLGYKTMTFLSKFARKAEDALPATFENMINSAMPKMPNDFASIAQADAISGLKRTNSNPYDVLRPQNVNTAGALASLTKTPRSPQVMTPNERRTKELVYGEFDPMTAAENARMMEMQNPAGDYDVTQ